ncbi:MAG: anti-sigma F factor antagonist [Heliobacteriaceae bacterium]|nr:anti-sigma F factor antagonist [Heliobacteriaceae bacterium]
MYCNPGTVEIGVFDGVLVVRLQGELDLGVSEGLRVRIDKELDRQRTKNLVFNFRDVKFIDSSGLGLVLGRYKKLAAQGGGVALTGTNSTIDRILELSGLFKIMRGYAGESEAIRALNGGGR